MISFIFFLFLFFFQAGLIKEIPTIMFLEEYARVVLQKSIESLYACGGANSYICQLTVISKLLMFSMLIIIVDS